MPNRSPRSGVGDGRRQLSHRAIEDPQPDPVLRRNEVERARVAAGSAVAVGVEQLGVVEDTATPAGADAAVRAIRAGPGAVAARLPREPHGPECYVAPLRWRRGGGRTVSRSPVTSPRPWAEQGRSHAHDCGSPDEQPDRARHVEGAGLVLEVDERDPSRGGRAVAVGDQVGRWGAPMRSPRPPTVPSAARSRRCHAPRRWPTLQPQGAEPDPLGQVP